MANDYPTPLSDELRELAEQLDKRADEIDQDAQHRKG
jgi:hypothetical protein